MNVASVRAFSTVTCIKTEQSRQRSAKGQSCETDTERERERAEHAAVSKGANAV